MFGLTFLQFVAVISAIVAIFSALAGGIVWLVGVATTKGKEEATAIKAEIHEMSRSFTTSLNTVSNNLTDTMDLKTQMLSNKIEANASADKERAMNLDQRLQDHNTSVAGKLAEIKERQDGQLDYIKNVETKTTINTRDISKISNRVSLIEGHMRTSQ